MTSRASQDRLVHLSKRSRQGVENAPQPQRFKHKYRGRSAKTSTGDQKENLDTCDEKSQKLRPEK